MQNFFFIRVDKKNVRINFPEIEYIAASKNYIQIITQKRSYMALLSMRQMEEILPTAMFCRIHRSYIVSLNHIAAFDNRMVQIRDIELPIGEQYRNVITSKVLVVQSDVRHQPAMEGLGAFRIMETPN